MKNLQHINRAISAVGVASLLAACVAGNGTGLPGTIVIERSRVVPEGIEYDNLNNRLLVGSLTEGSIYAVAANGGLTPVIEDPELMGSVGIEVDEEGNRILAANSRFGGGTPAAKLGVYELDTGDQIAMVDLTSAIPDRDPDSAHFANDVAISAAGTAFVTDSPLNIVYKVDRYYNATVLLDLGSDSGYSFNGIEYHPAGYLIVAAPGTGDLLKVPVNNPGNWSVVELDFSASGADGLVWAEDGSLVITSNNRSRVVKFTSDDNWRSARVTGLASFDGQVTTAAVAGNEVFAVEPIFRGEEPPRILRAQF